MPPRTGVAPVFAALEGGYYREQGLEPEGAVLYHGHSNSLKALITVRPIRRMRSGPNCCSPICGIRATP